VFGYYAEQIEGMISPSAAQYSGSSRIVSATKLGTGIYRVTIDSDVTYCSPTVTGYSGTGVYASAYDFGGTNVTVYTWTLNNTTHLAVPTDMYFYLKVSC
jgi:hypothetical protein